MPVYRAGVSDDGYRDARLRAMGTDVLVLAADGPDDLEAWAAARLEHLEARWSRFRATSDVSRLNGAAGAPVMVAPETLALVRRALDACRATGGLFDPTVLPALVAAGYDRDFDAVARDADDAVPAATAVPGCGGIVVDDVVGTIRLPVDVAIDLGGIGKGTAADLLCAELTALGARGALVDIGGDLRAVGAPPAEHGWLVEVDDPMGTGRTGMLAVMAGAIATSTRLRRAWTRAGRTMHHLIDPRTGAPARSGLASVTTVAGEAWEAEVLAKAALVAGPAAGRRLLLDAGATGLFLHDDGRVEDLPGLEPFRVPHAAR